jgi:hypothetical protein
MTALLSGWAVGFLWLFIVCVFMGAIGLIKSLIG